MRSTANGSETDFFTPSFLPQPLDFWSISEEERASLQTAILSCKWCTLSLFRKCQREYIHHALSRKAKYLTFTPSGRDLLNNIDSFLDNIDETCDKAAGGRKGKGDLVIPAQLLPEHTLHVNEDENPHAHRDTQAQAQFQTQISTSTSTDRKLAIWLHFGAIQIREQHEVYYENNLFRLPASPILHPARIPDKLLSSPWSTSQFEFLQLLAPEFYLDEDEHEAERSSAITMRLIRRRQIQPFATLLRMYFRAANCRVPARWPLLSVHFALIVKYAKSNGDTDPFARVVIDERWDDVPVDVREDLLRVGG